MSLKLMQPILEIKHVLKHCKQTKYYDESCAFHRRFLLDAVFQSLDNDKWYFYFLE